MKKRTMRRLKDYPPNVPRRLFHKLKECKFNRSLCASEINVNSGHLSKLLNDGIEPKDNDIRKKMFLPLLKIKRQQNIKRERPPQPDYIKKWNHISREERHRVILQYLTWKDNQPKKVR